MTNSNNLTEYSAALALNISLFADTKLTSLYSNDSFSSSFRTNTKSSQLGVEYEKNDTDRISSEYKKNFESATVFAAQNTNITGKRSNFSIGMNTSLILTDSAFAINKPINGGSFVLLDPTDGNFSFSSNSINQNITKNVIVPVSPYRNGSILVSPEFSPEENFNLKEDNVSYNVSEKGSLTSKLKVIKTITVNGILLSKNGIPLSLYEGRVRKEDSSSSIEFMTDEEGRFSLDLPIAETNKDDQRLNLILLSYPEKVLAIKIKPNSEEKEINLGEVTFPVVLKSK